MRFYQKNNILSVTPKDYFFIFSVFLLITLTLLACWTTYTLYQATQLGREQQFIAQSNRLSRELTASFDYVTHIVKFLGEKVREDDARNLPRIATLLGGDFIDSEVARRQFSWAMFDWDTPDLFMRVSTRQGILKEPKSVAHRYYAQMAEKEPWVLHFDGADIGISSGQWVIPAGMGVTNKKGKFLGIISLGFNIANLTSNLEASIGASGLSFIVLNRNYQPVFQSADNIVQSPSFYKTPFALKGPLPAHREGFLPYPSDYGNIRYMYFQQMDHYPFIILMGYNTLSAGKELQEKLLPILTGILVFAFVSLGLILTLRHIVIRPIVMLSKTADQLAAGKDPGTFKFSHLYEIKNLSYHLLRVKRVLKREQRTHKKLAGLMEIIAAADKEKENFRSEIYAALRTPLAVLFHGTEITRRELLGPLNIKTYHHYLEAMHDAAKELKTFTSDVLYPTLMEIKPALDRCITLRQKMALEGQVTLQMDCPASLPPITVDPLRFRQVILSTLYYSLHNTFAKGRVVLEAAVDTLEQQKKFLRIIIRDNGAGLPEKERRYYVDSNHPKRPYDVPDTIHETQLGLSLIRHVVTLHQGSFSMDAHIGKGTIFTIVFPYKEETSPKPEETTDRTNVVVFRKSGKH